MIRYRHFALPNLYLLNGYTEFATPDGIEREYEREDELEHCVRRILVRKPRRLRGCDLRFLRRGLGLPQPQFGRLVDRTEQTIARWEKSELPVPAFVDLVIRLEFVAKFEQQMLAVDLRRYVQEQAASFPEKVVLYLNEAGWHFNLEHAYIATSNELLNIGFSDAPGAGMVGARFVQVAHQQFEYRRGVQTGSDLTAFSIEQPLRELRAVTKAE